MNTQTRPRFGSAEYFKERFFGGDRHPYFVYEDRVRSILRPEHTLLDAGCGRTAPDLVRYRGRAARLIGVDVVDFPAQPPGVELYLGNLEQMTLADESVDIIMARSVIEHVANPVAVYSEFRRVLRPGGRVIFLTANLWDYASIIASIVPNRFHPWIVKHTEGRDEVDTFPTQYKSNTKRAIYKAAAAANMHVESFEYLGQHPSYFMFNGFLYLLGTAYEKAISSHRSLHCLKGWILCTLTKQGDSK